MITAVAEPLLNPALPIGIIAVLGIFLAVFWIVQPFADTPEPQHEHRKDTRHSAFVGVGNVRHITGKPTWNFPARIDTDYADDDDVIEEGADHFREFLLDGTRTSLTR